MSEKQWIAFQLFNGGQETMAEATTAYIGLGSNLGDRQEQIRTALKKLGETEQIEVVLVSKIIETAPLAQANQPKYLNATVEIKTTLGAEDLHKKIAAIETSLGRVRQAKWSPRIIDLDLLLYGDKIINRPNLTIPHPQIHLRSFVLKGLCELNRELVHPVLKKTVDELVARLNGADFVIHPDWPQLVSIAGIIGVGKTTLTKRLSKLFGHKAIFEAYNTNPFLPQVYAGKNELALDSQLYFLTSRVAQLNNHSLTAGEIVFADYVFDKELIYARCLLNAEQLAVYNKIHKQIVSDVAAPVLVIYLTDSVENCLERIRRRNRPYEQKIEPKFLEALDRGYKKLFADWKKCPVIRQQTPDFDNGKDVDVELLAKQIKSYVAA
jgi:2-amino-4-hydroxy-6-hydroxymethyldihydropteridine diphosphokinase